MPYGSWDDFIRDIISVSDLDQVDKERAKRAGSFIKDTFSVSFDHLIAQNHPIVPLLWRNVARTRLWLIRFADALERTSQSKNWDEMVEKLKMPGSFYDTLFELETAYSFTLEDFDLEFYPTAPSGRVPDLKIVNPSTREGLFVESTILSPTNQERQFARARNMISNRVARVVFKNNLELVASCHLYKQYISNVTLHRILDKIGEVEETAKRAGHAEYKDEGLFSIAIATKEKMALFPSHKFATLFGCQLPMPDHLSRLFTTINEETKQLVKDKMNVLVIHDERMPLMISDNAEDAIRKIEEFVYDSNRLAFCILLNSSLSGTTTPRIVAKDAHLYTQIQFPIGTRQALILTNSFIKDKTITLNTSSRVKRAFTHNSILIELHERQFIP